MAPRSAAAGWPPSGRRAVRMSQECAATGDAHRNRTTCSTASSATRPTCPSPSTPPTPTGPTLANFAPFDLLGRQLSPRIRDLGKITLYRTGPRAEFTDRYPRCGPLLTRKLNTELITNMWDDLAAGRRVRPGWARHRRAGRRETVLVQAAVERAHLRDQGVRGAAPHRLRRAVPGRRDIPAAHRSPAQQGREHGQPSPRCAARAGGSTTKSSPTFGRPTTRTSTSTAPTPSTSTANWPSSTPTGTGRYVVRPSDPRVVSTRCSSVGSDVGSFAYCVGGICAR